MASLQQLRRIFAPILTQHPDLVLHGRWLFRPPIETAIVGLFIDRTSSASDSNMAVSVVPLSRFAPPSAVGYCMGFEVERVIGVPPPGDSGHFDPDAPPRTFADMFAPDYQAHLIRNFNAKVPQFLDAVRTHEDVAAWVQHALDQGWLGVSPYTAGGWLAAMRGDFQEAADRLQEFLQRMPRPRLPIVIAERREDEALRDILRTGDPAAIAAHLHAMEERTIAFYKLQRFWRRTPFPFE